MTPTFRPSPARDAGSNNAASMAHPESSDSWPARPHPTRSVPSGSPPGAV